MIDTFGLTEDDLHPTYQGLVKLIGLENTLKIVKEFGGGEIYFPTIREQSKAARNRKICAEYKIHNGRKLASKYDLSHKQIKNIVKEGKKLGHKIESFMPQPENPAT